MPEETPMNKEFLKEALNEYFSPHGDNKRFFDATQIPRICNDISGIRRGIEAMEARASKASDDQETRIRALEKSQWKWTGAASILGALGMWLLQNLTR